MDYLASDGTILESNTDDVLIITFTLMSAHAVNKSSIYALQVIWPTGVELIITNDGGGDETLLAEAGQEFITSYVLPAELITGFASQKSETMGEFELRLPLPTAFSDQITSASATFVFEAELSASVYQLTDSETTVTVKKLIRASKLQRSNVYADINRQLLECHVVQKSSNWAIAITRVFIIGTVAQNSNSEGVFGHVEYLSAEVIQKSIISLARIGIKEFIAGLALQKSEISTGLVIKHPLSAAVVQKTNSSCTLIPNIVIKADLYQITESFSKLDETLYLIASAAQKTYKSEVLLKKIPVIGASKQKTASLSNLIKKYSYIEAAALQRTISETTSLATKPSLEGISEQKSFAESYIERKRSLIANALQKSYTYADTIYREYLSSDYDSIVTYQNLVTNFLSAGTVSFHPHLTQNTSSYTQLLIRQPGVIQISTLEDGVETSILSKIRQATLSSKEDSLRSGDDALVSDGGVDTLDVPGARVPEIITGVCGQQTNISSSLTLSPTIKAHVAQNSTASCSLFITTYIEAPVLQRSLISARFTSYYYFDTAEASQRSFVAADIDNKLIQLSARADQTTSIDGILFIKTLKMSASASQLSFSFGYLDETAYLLGDVTQTSNSTTSLFTRKFISGIVAQQKTIIAGNLKEKTVHVSGEAIQVSKANALIATALPPADVKQITTASAGLAESIGSGYCNQKTKISALLVFAELLDSHVGQKTSSFGDMDADDHLTGKVHQLSNSFADLFISQKTLEGEAKQITLSNGRLKTTKYPEARSAQRSLSNAYLLYKIYLNGIAAQKTSGLAFLSEGLPPANAYQVSFASSEISAKTPFTARSPQESNVQADLALKHILTGKSYQTTLASAILAERAIIYGDAVNLTTAKAAFVLGLQSNVEERTKASGQIRDSTIGRVDNPSIILYIEE